MLVLLGASILLPLEFGSASGYTQAASPPAQPILYSEMRSPGHMCHVRSECATADTTGTYRRTTSTFVPKPLRPHLSPDYRILRPAKPYLTPHHSPYILPPLPHSP